MKIDMHCHTSEGSPDCRVSIFDTIEILKSKGYNGMLVTDHNSYKGYEVWEARNMQEEDFILIKAIEYDTMDAGHFIIVLPSDVHTNIFTNRGMHLEETIKIVHSLGGIIGAAHPFDYYKLGACNHMKWVRNIEILRQLDFLETFNSCGRVHSNYLAELFCEFLGIPSTGGSDSHRVKSVGCGGTIFSNKINTADDLIKVIKDSTYEDVIAEGTQFKDSCFARGNLFFCAGLRGYYLLNTVIAKIKQPKLRKLMQQLNIEF